jgi:hypothetical protein
MSFRRLNGHVMLGMTRMTQMMGSQGRFRREASREDEGLSVSLRTTGRPVTAYGSVTGRPSGSYLRQSTGLDQVDQEVPFVLLEDGEIARLANPHLVPGDLDFRT